MRLDRLAPGVGKQRPRVRGKKVEDPGCCSESLPTVLNPETQRKGRVAHPLLPLRPLLSLSHGARPRETFTERTEPERQREDRSLTIKLQKQKPEKTVEWTSDTVDSKHMGRHPSKAAVTHEKPQAFGVSSMESGEEEKGCGLAVCKTTTKDSVIEPQDQGSAPSPAS